MNFNDMTDEQFIELAQSYNDPVMKEFIARFTLLNNKYISLRGAVDKQARTFRKQLETHYEL